MLRKQLTWLNGTSFIVTDSLWPHNIQHLWPVLNVRGLGLDLKRIAIFGPLFYHRDRFKRVRLSLGARNPYNLALMHAIADTYSLAMLPPDLKQYGQFWGSAGGSSLSIGCP